MCEQTKKYNYEYETCTDLEGRCQSQMVEDATEVKWSRIAAKVKWSRALLKPKNKKGAAKAKESQLMMWRGQSQTA